MTCSAVPGAACCCNTDTFLYFNPCPDAPVDAEGFKALKSTWESILPGSVSVNDVYKFDPGNGDTEPYCGKIEESGSSTGSPPATGWAEVEDCNDSDCNVPLYFFTPCVRRDNVYDLAATGSAWESLLGITISNPATWQGKVWSYKRNDGEDCCEEFPCVEWCGELSALGDTSNLCFEPGVSGSQKFQCPGCRVENLETQVIDANSSVTFTLINYEGSSTCDAPVCSPCQVPACKNDGFIKVSGVKTQVINCTHTGAIVTPRNLVGGCNDDECNRSIKLTARVVYDAYFDASAEASTSKFTQWPSPPAQGDSDSGYIVADYPLSHIVILESSITGDSDGKNIQSSFSTSIYDEGPGQAPNNFCRGNQVAQQTSGSSSIFGVGKVNFTKAKLQKRIGFVTRDVRSTEETVTAIKNNSEYANHWWKRLCENEAAPQIPEGSASGIKCYMTLTTECEIRPTVAYSGATTVNDPDFGNLTGTVSYSHNPGASDQNGSSIFTIHMSDSLMDRGGEDFSCCAPKGPQTNLFNEMLWTNAPNTIGPTGLLYWEETTGLYFRALSTGNVTGSNAPQPSLGGELGGYIGETLPREAVRHMWAAEYIFDTEIDDQTGATFTLGYRMPVYLPNTQWNNSAIHGRSPLVLGCGYGTKRLRTTPPLQQPGLDIVEQSGAPWLSLFGNENAPGNKALEEGTFDFVSEPDGYGTGISYDLGQPADLGNPGTTMQGFPCVSSDPFPEGWRFDLSRSEGGGFRRAQTLALDQARVVPIDGDALDGCTNCFRSMSWSHLFTHYHTVTSIECVATHP